MRVKGSDGSIWAFGDASTIDQPRALQRADELFELADTDKVRSMVECRGIVCTALGCLLVGQYGVAQAAVTPLYPPVWYILDARRSC